MTKNILLTGVGGQGTIRAAKMLTIGLMEEGDDVKMSEIHGMSQRGGSVTSQVRYSKEKVDSPVIEKGTADIVVSFEEIEAARCLDYLRADGTVVVNTVQIPSMTVLTGAQKYPKDILDDIRAAAPRVIALDATRMAEELGNGKAANVILLGALVEAMGLSDIDWDGIIRSNVKPQFVELNLAAFAKGKEAVR